VRIEFDAVQIRWLQTVDVRGRHGELKHDLRAHPLGGQRRDCGGQIRKWSKGWSLLATRREDDCEKQQAEGGWPTAVLFCSARPVGCLLLAAC
jgi:hypothetical protein